MTTVQVRFISATETDVRATGRHSPLGWRAPAVGETVPITCNSVNLSEFAWGGAAMPMYVTGGIIAVAGAALTWLGWPSSRPTTGTGTMPPAGPGHAAQAFATRPPNKNGNFGRHTRVQPR